MTQYIEIPVLKPRMMQFTVLTFFEGCFVGGFTIFGHFRHTVCISWFDFPLFSRSYFVPYIREVIHFLKRHLHQTYYIKQISPSYASFSRLTRRSVINCDESISPQYHTAQSPSWPQPFLKTFTQAFKETMSQK